MLNTATFPRFVKISWIPLLLIMLGCSAKAVQQEAPQEEIRLNQIGFYPQAVKKAVIEQDVSGSFYLIEAESGKKVYTGTLSGERYSKYGNRMVRVADFSDFTASGSYQLHIPDIGNSYIFDIKSRIHREVADAALKSYYFQRASTELPEAFAGKWHRQAGHPDDSVLIHSSAANRQRPEGTVITSDKGWYDAGDYNKYIVNSGISTGTLLALFEDYPAYSQTIKLNIPEKDNELPDLLDETLWNLRWMLTMQDPADGGVYHKMTSPDFSGMVMPHEDTDARYVIQKSSAATLDFAAVMAQAARIFEGYEQQLPGLADSCLTSAKKAWTWAQEHPDKNYNQRRLNREFDPDISTGAYGDNNVEDNWVWAASELFATTGEEKYLDRVKMSEEALPVPSWGQVTALGYYTLIRHSENGGEVPEKLLEAVRKKVLDRADQLAEAGKETAYQTVMGHSPDNFEWGSSAVAANQGILLLQAYRLDQKQAYLDGALSNLDYLLGRNGTGYSFLTGYGDKTPMHIHHRPSEADGIEEPVPGLLAGGPNPGQQDDCEYPTDIADQSYVDAVCSYASNEIAINWNSPLVYLAYAVEAHMMELEE